LSFVGRDDDVVAAVLATDLGDTNASTEGDCNESVARSSSNGEEYIIIFLVVQEEG